MLGALFTGTQTTFDTQSLSGQITLKHISSGALIGPAVVVVVGMFHVSWRKSTT